MKYRDDLKETMKYLIETKLGLPVKLSYVSEGVVEPRVYPKLLFKANVGEGFKVIDYDVFDKMGVEAEPKLSDIVGLFMCANGVSSEILDYTDNIIVLKEPINSGMVEYISELTIKESEHIEENNDDYFFISSLFSRTKRLNALVVEHYRRFEIGIFCKGDEDESKANYYKTQLSDLFDRDFVILDSDNLPTKNVAYIFTPLKFDVTEHGRQDRLIYGSVMIRTYK